MGMYDYLITNYYETQIKCFYIPVYHHEGFMRGTSHSGGSLRSITIGDEAPVQTLYYKYPPNFLVRLYEFEDYDFAIFKQNKFDGFISINDASNIDKEFHNNVYSSYGTKLKVKDYSDLLQYYEEEIKEFYKEFNQRNYMNFYQRWNEPLPLECQLGEYFDCLPQVKAFAELDNHRVIDHKERLTCLIEDIGWFKRKYPKIYNDFVERNNLQDWAKLIN